MTDKTGNQAEAGSTAADVSGAASVAATETPNFEVTNEVVIEPSVEESTDAPLPVDAPIAEPEVTDGAASPSAANAPAAASDEQVQPGAEAVEDEWPVDEIGELRARVEALEAAARAGVDNDLSKFLENLNTTINDRFVRVEQKIKHF